MAQQIETPEDRPPTALPPTRVFLVIVDDSQEMPIALHYACRRARNGGGRVALLRVLEPADFQQWMSVADLMENEQRENAENLLQRLGKTVIEKSGRLPVFHIRQGHLREELANLIAEDKSISVLVLAAASAGDNPGPLINHISGKGLGSIRVPVTIIPAGMTEADLDPIT